MWRAPAWKNSDSTMKTTCANAGWSSGAAKIRGEDELIAKRCATADAVADWVREHGHNGQHEHCGPSNRSTPSAKSKRSSYRELAANAALVLIAVACSLLDRQIASLAAAFVEKGGFTERLHSVRTKRRGRGPPQ